MTRDVVLTMVSDTYTDSVRRGFYSTADQTILSLLESAEIGKVLVADHPRGLLSQVRRRWHGDHPAPRSGRLRGVRPATLTTPTPLTWPAIARRYRAYDRQLEIAARRHGLRNPALVTFNLWHAAVATSPWATSSIFYAQDDESAIPHRSAHRELSRHAYHCIDQGRSTVVAVSDVLLGRIAEGSGGMVIANGVDPELWTILPPRVTSLGPRPVAIYAGSVDDRLDVAAFASLAANGYDVQIVGGVADSAVGAELNAIEHVTLTGSLPRASVVNLMRAADVCVLAHRDTELTQAMSPLKLFEYLASGTPVIATHLGGVGEHGTTAILVDPDGDYVVAAGAALQAGPIDEKTRRTLVASMSWRNRHKPLIKLIHE